MNSEKELRANIEAVDAIEGITSVYQGIASLRMNQVRVGVTRTRDFITGVAELYQHARLAYLAAIDRKSLSLAGKKDVLGLFRRNGKSVAIFVSANEHLYGTLILEIWNNFLLEVKNGGVDAVVIGNFGKALMNREKLPIKITFLDLDDDKPEPEQIKKLIQIASEYERIILHYGQMKSLMRQLPVREEISRSVVFDEKVKKAKTYLFEPTPEKIMEFFEKEIIGALLNQKIFEHQLARFAARMVAMDLATQNAETTKGKMRRQLTQVRKRSQNAKQLEVFAGMSAWKEKKDE